MYFSFIIPVYNRPDEINELLQTLTKQTYTSDFEVVVIEDGSTINCQSVVDEYINKLNISYYFNTFYLKYFNFSNKNSKSKNASKQRFR